MYVCQMSHGGCIKSIVCVMIAQALSIVCVVIAQAGDVMQQWLAMGASHAAAAQFSGQGWRLHCRRVRVGNCQVCCCKLNCCSAAVRGKEEEADESRMLKVNLVASALHLNDALRLHCREHCGCTAGNTAGMHLLLRSSVCFC
jgi:hypothetical protein